MMAILGWMSICIMVLGVIGGIWEIINPGISNPVRFNEYDDYDFDE